MNMPFDSPLNALFMILWVQLDLIKWWTAISKILSQVWSQLILEEMEEAKRGLVYLN